MSSDLAEEFRDVMGAGQSENVEDRGNPLIYLAQKSSPQVDKNKPEFVAGLEVGNAFNSLTGEYWDAEKEGLPFLPCAFRSGWALWTPREQGGGFHGMQPFCLPADVPKKFAGAKPHEDKKGNVRRDIFDLPDGRELVLTHQYFGLIMPSLSPAVVPMTSTNLKASQQTQALISNTRMQLEGRIVTPPAYLLPWVFYSVYASNDQGTWYRWMPKRLGSLEDQSSWTPPEIRAVCRELALAVSRNEVRVAEPLEREGDGKDVPI